MNQKTQVVDNKWEARVKEYETRLKTAEEKVKRERQGGKERVGELEVAVKYVDHLLLYRSLGLITITGPWSDRMSCQRNG